MTESLRPLNLGEILDRTAQLYRRHFALFAGTAAVPTLVVVACFVLLGGVLIPSGVFLRGGRQAGAPATVAIAMAGLVAVAATIAATVLSQSAITRAAVNVFAGRKMKICEALASVRPRFWRYLWLMMLQGLLAAGIPAAAAAAILGLMVHFGSRIDGNSAAGAAMALLAVGVVLAAAAVAIILALELALGLSASVAENKPAWPSIRRAVSLSKGTRGRIFAMLLVVGAAAMALSMIGSIPVFIVAVIVGAAGAPGQSAFILVVIAEIFNVLVSFALQTLITPAYLIALVLFYYDQRIRKEGYDIEWMMEKAGLTPAGNPGGASGQTAASMPMAGAATVKEL